MELSLRRDTSLRCGVRLIGEACQAASRMLQDCSQVSLRRLKRRVYAGSVLAAWGLASLPGPVQASDAFVLTGKVVTLNATSDILARGALLIKNGRIERVVADVTALGETAAGLPILATNGAIYPGMIDLHNHPEYAIYPLLPIKRKYKDRYEWRFYDDDYAKRITYLNELLTRPFYLDLGLEVGRYGELKALVGGTTSLQGARSNLAYAREECLVRNIETSPVSTRRAFSRVDIGRDAEEWRRMADERSKGPLVVHLAEGTGPRMANEFEAIKRSGLLGPELVAVHGVAFTPSQFKEMAEVGAKLVWSPLSNLLLYGQTADIAAAKRAGVSISLAPDWTPSGSKSSLGELKVADLVNKHQLAGLLSDEDLVRMVTTEPAKAMGWEGRLGVIAEGALADLLIVDTRSPNPYRNLIESHEGHVQLVVVRGQGLYGDAALVSRLRKPTELEPLEMTSPRRKLIATDCPGTSLPSMSLRRLSETLQSALELPLALFASRVSIEQFSKDLAICGIAKPSDPPTAADTTRLLRCRYGLPFERTRLSPLWTYGDKEFFSRLQRVAHLPKFMHGLQRYYLP